MALSLIFLQSYVNVECALQDTAGEQNKNLQMIYCSEYLAIVQDWLVAQQPPTLTTYVMTQDATQIPSNLDAGP